MMNKTKKMLSCAFSTGCLAAILSFGVSADEFHFSGVKALEYYPTKSYESAYGSAYSYGGINAVDNVFPELPFGVTGSALSGAMEKAPLYGRTPVYSLDGPPVNYGLANVTTGEIHETSDIQEPLGTSAQLVYQLTAFSSVGEMVQSDGSIGTLSIPSLKISMKVWDGETDESMAKGLGHYSLTSGWNGNVALCGHNRGASYVIGSVKDMKPGDEIIYQTVYGTRTYAVTNVVTISNTDWSHMQPTTDNRLTITTCLAGQPEFRVCVQAVEIIP